MRFSSCCRDVFRNELCVDIGVLHLDDVHVHGRCPMSFARSCLDGAPRPTPPLPMTHAGLARYEMLTVTLSGRALDLDLGYACSIELLLQVTS